MIPTFLIKKFGPLGAKLIFFGGLALMLAAILLLTYCQGRSDGKNGEVIEAQKREIDTQIDLGHANENASVARVEDATRAEQQKGELEDALKASNDPSRQRILRGCIVLRQQGRDTSNLPQCR